MKLTDYEALPDAMAPEKGHRHCMSVLDESVRDDPSVTLAKLDEMSIRQWHTCESPDPALQSRLSNWLIEHWVSANQNYLESVLSLSYCFALDKEFYRCAIQNYTGEHLMEFQRDLEKSDGGNIDPWWSMKQQTAQPKTTADSRLKRPPLG